MDAKKELLELKDKLEHLRAIASAKEKILLAYIEEENSLYRELSKKVREIKEKNKAVEETRAIMSQNERLFTLGIMLASFAHEVKNPLIVILGMLERLEKQPLDTTQKELLKITKKESLRIQEIMNRLTQYYRPQDDSTKGTHDINDLIIETLNLTRHYLQRFNKIELITDLSAKIPIFSFNRGQIQQVLVNFIINSAQAMPEGGTIKITTHVHDDASTPGKKQIAIHIQDTGTGITPENLEKIFTPFFSTKKTGEGTGLGLAISKEIIERHQGRITVKSSVGEGTMFTIYLPVFFEKTATPGQYS